MRPVGTIASDHAQASGQVLEVVSSVVRLLRQAAGGAPSGEENLSLTEFRLLKRVAAEVRLARELAAELDVTAATISVAVEGLARRGLVERRASPEDRRAVPLVATPAGLAALEAARQRQQQALSAIVAGLSPAERRALQLAVAGLTRVLGGSHLS